LLFEYGTSAKWLDLLKEIRRSHQISSERLFFGTTR